MHVCATTGRISDSPAHLRRLFERKLARPFLRPKHSLPGCATMPRRAFHGEEAALATEVMAPMVGKVLRLAAKVGDHVNEDDPVVVIEAMKMEIEVVAPAGGTISEIKVAPGD